MTNRERWLIIDDDAVFASLLSNRLTKHHFDVEIAHDAFSALQKIKQSSFDKIVLDLNLSDQSGLELLPELVAIAPNVKILMLTGYASIATTVTAMKQGAFNYLPKPSSTQQIIEALSSEKMKNAEPKTRLSADEVEWEHIQQALKENEGNISATARELNMHRRTLQRKLSKKRNLK